MRMKLRFKIPVLLIFLSGCVGNAPHDNPLDPLSSNYSNIGNLSGHITIAHRETGVPGAMIMENALKIFVVSDSLGYFSFTGLASGVHTFICTKTNFTFDTFQVAIKPGEKSEIVRALNGAPNVSMQKILTRKIDYVSYNPQYYVELEAEVTDPNSTDPSGINDLDSVWFTVDTLSFPMSYNSSSKKFTTTVFSNELLTNTIQWLTSKPLHIVSRDQYSAVNISEPFYISRIIENAATPILPSLSSTVAKDSLFFKWTPPDVAFNYSTTITVYRTGTEQVVWTHSGILSSVEQYPADGSVISFAPGPGNYFWTVTIVDDFGNYSRSKESYFVVN